MPFAARAQGKGDSYKADGGEILIAPVSHASFVMSVPGLVIYNDPVGDKAIYDGQPAAQLVLITHEHQDHFQPETLAAIVGADTKLIVNPSVMEKLPADLKAKATSIGNGGNATVGPVTIDAIPAYNTTEDRKKYHPQGRDNGYVLTAGGMRVYIAGDTEDIPEMRALKDIDIAFVPMNLPFTMDVDQASSAVAEFKPAIVYPYHYKGSDPATFATKVTAAAPEVKVVQGAWYG
jgi:L-ascorbate metabolism protein UlaG (beta-lactamase superfamily)